MDNQDFTLKAKKHGEIISAQKEILQQVRNLAWKQSETGCFTAERQSRINRLQAQHDSLKLEAAAVWSNQHESLHT